MGRVQPVGRSHCGGCKVDRFGEQCLSAILQSFAFRLRIAIGSDQDDWNVRLQSFGLGQEFKTAHPWHVDVGQDQDERYPRRIGDALECHGGGLRKSIVRRPVRRSRRNCWRNRTSTSGSSSTTRMSRFTCVLLIWQPIRSLHRRPLDAAAPRCGVNGPRHCAQRHQCTKSRTESGVPSISHAARRSQAPWLSFMNHA